MKAEIKKKGRLEGGPGEERSYRAEEGPAQFVMSNVVLRSRIGRYVLYHSFCASLPE